MHPLQGVVGSRRVSPRVDRERRIPLAVGVLLLSLLTPVTMSVAALLWGTWWALSWNALILSALIISPLMVLVAYLPTSQGRRGGWSELSPRDLRLGMLPVRVLVLAGLLALAIHYACRPPVDANVMAKTFSSRDITAIEDYQDREVVLAGSIISCGQTNAAAEYLVYLHGNADYAIECRFKLPPGPLLRGDHVDQAVQVRGFCTGLTTRKTIELSDCVLGPLQ